jgi:hypothetical protein
MAYGCFKVVFITAFFYSFGLEAAKAPSKNPVNQSSVCATLLSALTRQENADLIKAIDNAKRFADLPPVTFLPLPRAQENMIVDYIERHGFNDSLFGGKKPVFLLSNFINEIPTEANTIGFGETIQAMFLAKVLRFIFPTSEIRPLNKIINADRAEVHPINYTFLKDELPIRIEISDKSEGFESERKEKEGPGHFDMPLLKAANGTLGYIQGDDLRRQMGIPTEAFVTSLYFKDSQGSTENPSWYPSISGAVKEISKTKVPDVIFITEGGQTIELFLSDLESQGYVVKKLSSLIPKDLAEAKKKKVAVINDLAGFTPYLHATADIAVIKGPINIFEPLTVKTPVLFFQNDLIYQEYERVTFDEMTEIAKATGGAYSIRSTTQFPLIFGNEQILQNNSIIPPYKTVVAGKQIPLDRFMDRLFAIIKNQVH